MLMQVKLIDFGAAVDMCTGINFNPQTGMLDPRYRCVLIVDSTAFPCSTSNAKTNLWDLSPR